ncbi:thiol:disulfide interchange protein DsbA/DsbL [Ningiella sp. W23]|uniref:thiol:disulfide interchange protein DsbA/DsbL n=1 Tax=Ningiella sp. W23 TaxID=3023715 RepID=UPI0037584D14
MQYTQKYIMGFFALGLFALLLPMQACSQVVQWEEGTHYEIISDEATAKPEVKEFFSFWCPACYRFEPIAKQIENKLAEDVAFDKVHVNFMGGIGPDIQDTATKAMMIGRSLDKDEALNAAIFNYIHEQRAIVTSLDDWRKVFVVNGVDGEEFDKLAKSFSINSLVARNKNELEANRANVTGVPTFIVNGKYKAIFSRDRSMTMDDMVNLVVWLSEQD